MQLPKNKRKSHKANGTRSKHNPNKIDANHTKQTKVTQSKRNCNKANARAGVRIT